MSEPVSRRSILAGLAALPLVPRRIGPTDNSATSRLRQTVQPAATSVVDPAGEISPELAIRSLARGRAVKPLARAKVASVPGSGRVSPSVVQGASDYLVYPFPLFTLEPGSLPYARLTPMPLVDTETHDSFGVRMTLRGAVLYDHPVAQAQYGIMLLESHRLTADQTFVDRAILQAQRLVDRRIEHQGWWFPYSFVYAVHRTYEVFKPPWFSMMAQGQALSLFVRLFELTGDPVWRVAADQTYATFLVAPVAGQPWGVHVVDGLLWLDEYPSPVSLRGDRTYNGHIFSAFGLYDYWRLTPTDECTALLRAALTTARDGGLLVRSRGWRSHYCVTHGLDAGYYHTTHIHENLSLQGITQDPVFAQRADLFAADYPPLSSGSVHFQPGSYTGYKFNSGGGVLASKPLGISHSSSAPDTDRGKVIRHSGIWYQISAGTLAGYEVQEWPSHCYQVGMYAVLSYLVQRPGTVVAKPGSVYNLSAAGLVGSRLTSLKVGDAVDIQTRAVVNGVEFLLLATGVDAGWWVATSGVLLL